MLLQLQLEGATPILNLRLVFGMLEYQSFHLILEEVALLTKRLKLSRAALGSSEFLSEQQQV